MHQYTSIAISTLNDRPFVITGNVESIRVTGLDEDNAEITLSNPTSSHIIVDINLKKYDQLYNTDNATSSFKLIGAKLFYVLASKNVGASKGSHFEICTRNSPLKPENVRLKYSTPISTIFDWE